MQLHNTDPKRVKPILDRLTGIIPAAKLTAIMGPSGSGKTSFITSLAGRARYAKVTGGIYLNGSKVDLKSKAFRTRWASSAGRHHAHELTVFEQLLYTARLRLLITMRRETQLKGVHHVISQLRLDDVEHSIIGDAKRRGIPGQRKRVNIAMELMADPTILFCDEPTSGLDAANSLLVMAMLRSLSSRGLTIMAVIHQLASRSTSNSTRPPPRARRLHSVPRRRETRRQLLRPRLRQRRRAEPRRF